MDTLRAALDALPMPERTEFRPTVGRHYVGFVHAYTANDIRAAHRDGARLALERSIALCDVTPPYPFRPSIEAAHAIRELLKELGND